MKQSTKKFLSDILIVSAGLTLMFLASVLSIIVSPIITAKEITTSFINSVKEEMRNDKPNR